MAEDHGGDVHLLSLVLNDWNTFPVVPNFDSVVFSGNQNMVMFL